MQRNWELIRKILLKLEQQAEACGQVSDEDFHGFSSEQAAYHINLLQEAGLINARCTRFLNGGMVCVAQSLTWEGHEFLDKIRNDGVWNQVKTNIKGKGLDLTFDAIRIVAGKVIEAML